MQQASQAVDAEGDAPQHEDVPYVLLYITVRHSIPLNFFS